jgi:hypothetical protein
MSAEYLDALADAVERLLGSDFARLEAAYRRGLRSSTPQKNAHRLVELAAFAREDAEAFRNAEPSLHLEVLELDAAVGSLERWRHDPAVPELISSLTSATDVAHVTVTLVAASYMTDSGNAVELAPPSGDKRTPDLRLHLGATTRVNAEVKVPQGLVQPDSLDQSTAITIVRKALSNAGTGSGGQLNPERDAVLVVGATNLRQPQIDALEAAARVVATERPRDRTHLMGILVVPIGSLIEGVTAGPKGLKIDGPLKVSPIASPQFLANPNYSGALNVETERTATGERFRDRRESADVTAAAIEAAQAGSKIGRNDPCWCGSGKKFKKCHGR